MSCLHIMQGIGQNQRLHIIVRQVAVPGGGICRLRLHLVFCLLFCLLVKRGIALTGRNSTGPPWSVTDDDRRQLQSITSLAPVHYV